MFGLRLPRGLFFGIISVLFNAPRWSQKRLRLQTSSGVQINAHPERTSINFLQFFLCKTLFFSFTCVYSRLFTVNTTVQGSPCCCYSLSASKNSLVSSAGPGCNLGSRRGPAPIGLCPPCVQVMTPSLWGMFDLGCLCASAGPISGAWGG